MVAKAMASTVEREKSSGESSRFRTLSRARQACEVAAFGKLRREHPSHRGDKQLSSLQWVSNACRRRSLRHIRPPPPGNSSRRARHDRNLNQCFQLFFAANLD